jgi:hypothetical protein
VHHWLGTAFIAGTSLREAVDISHDIPSMPSVHVHHRSELLNATVTPLAPG